MAVRSYDRVGRMMPGSFSAQTDPVADTQPQQPLIRNGLSFSNGGNRSRLRDLVPGFLNLASPGVIASVVVPNSMCLIGTGNGGSYHVSARIDCRGKNR